MKKFAILSDSSCDLTPEYLKEHEIEYAHMFINWHDDEGFHEIPASLSWDVLSIEKFYEMMKSGIVFKTSLILKEEYLELFEKNLKEGRDVLYLACSSGLTASTAIGFKAAEELNSKYKDNKVIVIDTLRASMDQGLLVMRAVELRDEGKSIEEVADIITKSRLETIQIGTPDKLSFLRRAGRVKASKAFFGDMFGVKPILMFDDEGHNVALYKAKGRKNSLLEIARIAKENCSNPKERTAYLMQAYCSQEDIDTFKKALLEIGDFKDVVVLPLGPIIGASSGPGTINVYFWR